METLSTGTALIVGLVIAVLLAALHLATRWFRGLPFIPESATGSFAGGLAVAYVFLHLLPEIAEGNEAVGEALTNVLHPSPLFDLGIFFVALAGFTVFYGLERLADRTGGDPRVGRGEPDPPASVYALHVGSFMIYNALITYTMPLRLRTGLLFGVLFTIAMGLHFILTDRGLSEHYPRRFGRSGRIALAVALLIGWAAARLLAPTSTLLVSILTALLGGSILLNVFKEEVPSNRRSSFGWFLVGLVLYAVLLAAVTYVAE